MIFTTKEKKMGTRNKAQKYQGGSDNLLLFLFGKLYLRTIVTHTQHKTTVLCCSKH